MGEVVGVGMEMGGRRRGRMVRSRHAIFQFVYMELNSAFWSIEKRFGIDSP